MDVFCKHIVKIIKVSSIGKCMKKVRMLDVREKEAPILILTSYNQTRTKVDPKNRRETCTLSKTIIDIIN